MGDSVKMLFTQQLSPHDVACVLNFNGQLGQGRNPSRYREPDACGMELFDKQIEGTTDLYNTLVDGPVAYLADEVGMGKTYQALGVACLVYALKPNARIAIIAPRENIQRKWVDDYLGFVRDHYVSFDDCVKDTVMGQPLHPPCFADNLIGFASNVLRSPRALQILRLTSFQRPVAPRKEEKTVLDVIERLKDGFRRFGYSPSINFKGPYKEESPHEEKGKDLVRQWFTAAFHQLLPVFDLVIVDEAQNLRIRNNIRNTTLTRLFGLQPHWGEESGSIRQVDWLAPEPKMEKMLYLSATPAHRATKDIDAQLSYVLPHSDEPEAPPFEDDQHREDFLIPIMVRRLRRFGDKTKYGYRQESLLSCTPRDVYDHLTISLIQKYLERMISRSQNRFKIGFLSSFESCAPGSRGSSDKTHDDEQESSSAPDEAFLASINGSLQRFIRKHRPTIRENEQVPPLPHPKQDTVVETICETILNDAPEKVLVFVRRLASVHELVEKLVQAYDERLGVWIAELLPDSSSQKEAIDRLTHDIERRRMDERTDEVNPEENSSDTADTKQKGDEDEEHPPTDDRYQRDSQILGRFAGTKSGTRVGQFRSQFNAGRPLEPVFIENTCRLLLGESPGGFAYQDFVKSTLQGVQGHQRLRFIKHACAVNGLVDSSTGSRRQDVRRLYKVLYWAFISKLEDSHHYKEHLKLLQRSFNIIDPIKENEVLAAEIGEQRIFRILFHRSLWDILRDEAHEFGGKLSFLKEHPASGTDNFEESWLRREVLLEWISKCIRMSEGIILLAVARLRAEKLEGESLAERVSVAMAQLLFERGVLARRLVHRIVRMTDLEAYRPLLKVLSRGKEVSAGELMENKWTDLNHQKPIIGVVGGSGGRDRLAIQFKTPFFPDVLVATSVLAEGVDLHLFCDQIAHFGLPYTTGEMEQRIGRIDRYFSQIHRAIMRNGHDVLTIHYPYLPESIDETQLERVLAAKKQIEPMMDEGLSVAQSQTETEVMSERSGKRLLQALFTYGQEDGEAKDSIYATFKSGSDKPTGLLSHQSQGGKEHLSRLTKLIGRLQKDLTINGLECWFDSYSEILSRQIANFSVSILVDASGRPYRLAGAGDYAEISRARRQTVSLTLQLDPANGRLMLEATSAIGGIMIWRDLLAPLSEAHDIYPGIRICYDKNRRTPLWVEGAIRFGIASEAGGTASHMSYEEFRGLVERVALAADLIEYRLFEEDMDERFPNDE